MVFADVLVTVPSGGASFCDGWRLSGTQMNEHHSIAKKIESFSLDSLEAHWICETKKRKFKHTRCFEIAE